MMMMMMMMMMMYNFKIVLSFNYDHKPQEGAPQSQNTHYISVTTLWKCRSKEQVCGRWAAEIVGSSPTGGMDVCQL